MARIRYIKHGFFTNEKLADCQPLARLLFAGLWLIADREGRLEDRPRKIKIELLPFDDCDANLLLDELAEQGFIIRYQVAENRFIQIANFARHQHPHPKETPSFIPPKNTSTDTESNDILEQAENSRERQSNYTAGKGSLPDAVNKLPEIPKKATIGSGKSLTGKATGTITGTGTGNGQRATAAPDAAARAPDLLLKFSLEDCREYTRQLEATGREIRNPEGFARNLFNLQPDPEMHLWHQNGRRFKTDEEKTSELLRARRNGK